MSNIEKIIEAKLYLGDLKKRSNPKTRDYWLDVKNGLVLFDPEIILKQLDFAKAKIAELKKEGKSILIVSDKLLYKENVETIAQEMWVYYMNYKVPSWVLTNFDTLLSRVKTMNELKKYVSSEVFQKISKKERLLKMKELNKIQRIYKWVDWLKVKPDFVIVLDGMYMSKFVDELEKLNIDNLLLISSNFNRWWNQDKLVAMNMNSLDSINFVLNYILK